MKIVIDIDNETYARIQALVNADYFEHDICGYSMQRIANGTPYEDRPQGEWIILDSGDRACPFCNMGMSRESNPSLVFFNYCPFCGADMRVKDELNNELKELENEVDRNE